MTFIFKAQYDKKLYREIILQNGLKALLISDREGSSRHDLSLMNNHGCHVFSNANNAVLTSHICTDSDTDEMEVDNDEHELSMPKQHVSRAKERSSIPFNMKRRPHNSWERTHRYDSRIFSEELISESDSSGQNSVEIVMAAAALCVGVGSFSDPEDIPGFAHFLEHMVFMGSKKYKKENDFDKFISRHGGESNAWTDTEKTLFFFDVYTEHFHKALDMFAQFFVAPLLDKCSVDREIKAVDNEFQMLTTSDKTRYYQLLGSLAPGNPVSHFLCGNTATLMTDPEKMGVDVYGRLRDFCRMMYSAHYMTLVVQAPESLDDLEDIVYQFFEAIPNNDIVPLTLAKYVCPFTSDNFHKLFKVVPIKDCQRVDICWALPPLLKHFKVKPLEYIGRLVSHEGPGSILCYLRKKVWALSLTGCNYGSGFDFNKLWSGFHVSIILTDQGMEHVSEVIQTVFAYMKMLQRYCSETYSFTEMSNIESIKFRFKEEMDPIENVEHIAENMQNYPLEHYLTGRSLYLMYDDELIKECMNFFTPSSCCITLWSKAYNSSNICDKVCPWFGTLYALTEIPEQWESQWRELTCIPELQFPEMNIFIPSKFELLKIDSVTEYPIQVLDDELGQMWYKKDNSFKMPKGLIMLHLMTPLLSASVECATLCDLFIGILHQQLQEVLYAATLCGYEFSLDALSTGIVISIEGFSDKLLEVMDTIVRKIQTFTTTNEMFSSIKSQMKKTYYNEMINPYEFAKMLRFAVTEPSIAPIPDRYLMVETLTFKMLQDFHQRLFFNLYIEGLMIGNFSPQHAVYMAEFIQRQLCFGPLSPEERPAKRVLQLPVGSLQCRVRGANRHDTNSCVTSFYQYGPADIYLTCLNELLALCMKEPVFNKLRTDLQLGYSVFCSHNLFHGIIGFSVTVEMQANKFSVSDTQTAITRFLYDFLKVLKRMRKAQFDELVDTMITSKHVEDTQLCDEANRYWQEILDQTYVFNRPQREIKILETITLSELRGWFENYLDYSPRHISFQVEGCKHNPMAVNGQNVEKNGDQHDEIFLSLSSHGNGFITDIAKFRQSLYLYPVSKVDA